MTRDPNLEPAYHRTGMSSPLGKLKLPVKFLVDENTRGLAEREATQLGLSLSEFMRDLLVTRIHGVDVVKSLYAARVDGVAGNGTGI